MNATQHCLSDDLSLSCFSQKVSAASPTTRFLTRKSSTQKKSRSTAAASAMTPSSLSSLCAPVPAL